MKQGDRSSSPLPSHPLGPQGRHLHIWGSNWPCKVPPGGNARPTAFSCLASTSLSPSLCLTLSCCHFIPPLTSPVPHLPSKRSDIWKAFHWWKLPATIYIIYSFYLCTCWNGLNLQEEADYDPIKTCRLPVSILTSHLEERGADQNKKKSQGDINNTIKRQQLLLLFVSAGWISAAGAISVSWMWKE